MKAPRRMHHERPSPAGKEPNRPRLLLDYSIAFVASLLLVGCSDASVPQTDVSRAQADTAAVATRNENDTPGNRDGAVTITYLANEGFLIEAGERAVLVDALFGDGLKGYPTVPMRIRSDLESGLGRFGGVDCVLATHAHSDHFSATAVTRFLHRVPVQFISTQEAVEEIDSLLDLSKAPAPRWLQPPRHKIESVDCGGVPVSVMSFHHGSLMVKNLAYLVELDGLTVLHVGDTEITAEQIRPWDLANLEIDVALLPAWHLTEPSWTPVIEEIGARHLVAMHLASPDAPSSWFGSAGSLERRIAEIRQQTPAVWIPTEAGEERTFETRN